MNNHNNIQIILVTPELAKNWLANNTHNRTIRDRHVRGLANDMVNGEWAWNGESIKFAEDGTLLDGQHRLSAIVMTGISLEMLVLFNVEREAQHTMDTGSKRKASDMLKLRGEKNAVTLAAGARAGVAWDSGSRNFAGSMHRGMITNSMVLRYIEAHPELREYTTTFMHLRTRVPMPASVGLLAVKLFNEIDAEDAAYFFDRLASDEGHYKGEPVHALRSALLSPASSTKISHTPTYKLAITIKAWNKFRTGEGVGLLVYRPGGSNPEKFPEPI